MPKAPKIKTLSAYTIASNCVDLSDIEQGLKELKEFRDLTYKANADLPETYYIRLMRLDQKRDMFLKRYYDIDV